MDLDSQGSRFWTRPLREFAAILVLLGDDSGELDRDLQDRFPLVVGRPTPLSRFVPDLAHQFRQSRPRVTGGGGVSGAQRMTGEVGWIEPGIARRLFDQPHPPAASVGRYGFWRSSLNG
jgi:hypothetical protein